MNLPDATNASAATKLKITIVSAGDSMTGAARAAARIHRLQVSRGCNSKMLVASRSEKNWRIEGPVTAYEKVLPHLMPRLNNLIMSLQRSDNPILHSPGLFGSPAFGRIQRDRADVLNLHWVNHDMLSVRQIGKLNKPVVWTLHDSWAFCGSEHHPASATDRRYVDGYSKANRRSGHWGLDIDRHVWKMKRRLWKRKMFIVSPSRWLAECARESSLMADWPIEVIPNALPLDIYRPWDRATARALFGLPQDRPLVLFGAVGGTSNPLKGWAYLQDALKRLAHSHPDVAAVVLGQTQPRDLPDIGMDVSFIGHLFDDASLAMLYSAVDVVIVPSRLENLPQMATEAQSCGVPVVGFNCGGMPDVVEHGKTGYLAAPYDSAELASGIAWVISKATSSNTLGRACRLRAEAIWDQDVILAKYLRCYDAAIKAFNEDS